MYGDERKLRQVLINLLGNAVKFTEAGEIVLRVTASGRFEVRDTGPGIPPERLNDLFQPFTQLRDSTEAKEGTGLGLAISKRLVTIMGGDLQVSSSTPGAGSCFWFDLMLPATAEFAPARVVRDGAIAGYAGPQRQILIADDKAINRRVLIGMLEPLGFACSEAVDGKDCLQVAAARPDLILMDILMPRLDGLEAARQVHRAPESHDIPILAMSASVFEADRAQCLEVGCDEFITKPVVADKLLEAIARCLKLEWIYQEPADAKRAVPATSSEFEIEHLPGPIARALLEAARKGHAKGIMEQAQALEVLGEPYVAYARRLRELAKQFRFEEICTIAEECAQAAAGPA